MITRHGFRINAADRLLWASAAAARGSSSASALRRPARFDCHRQRQQLHVSSAAPPPPLLTTVARGHPPAAAVQVSMIARGVCSCSTRQGVRLTNGRRRFSAVVRRPPAVTREGEQDTEAKTIDSKRGSRQKVVVGMSGGVDSSVVAMLLQRQVRQGEVVSLGETWRREGRVQSFRMSVWPSRTYVIWECKPQPLCLLLNVGWL